MRSSREIYSRLMRIAALRMTLDNCIPPAVRLVSIEWNSDPEIFYFYVDGNKVEQVREVIEEEFSHVDPMPLGVHYDIQIIRLDEPHPVTYRGEAIYARREKFSSPPPFLKECSVLTKPPTPPFHVIKTYRHPELRGYGELVSCPTAIGYYLNPTTLQKTATKNIMVYYGQKRRYFIPAVPSQQWLTDLQLQFIEQGRQIDFPWHVNTECHRALLGKITPSLLGVTIPWHHIPTLVRFYSAKDFSAEDREIFELAWFEMQAGMSPEHELTVAFLKVPRSRDIPFDGLSLYLKST